jgi:Fic-DOC domain mobile mystery protein B
VSNADAPGWAGDEDGQTPVDADEAQFLTPLYAHIQTRSELNKAEALNIVDAEGWLEDQEINVRGLLNQTFLRDLHRHMFGEVWTWAGKLRQRETSIGIAPAQVQERFQGILGDVLYWIENETYARSEIGVRFHHLLVLIHPFANGNGRHARLVSNALARALGLGFDYYSWGRRSGLPAPHARSNYLSALRAADRHDYAPLLKVAVQ